jgi:hypothetical protein
VSVSRATLLMKVIRCHGGSSDGEQTLVGTIRPAVRNGDLAITATVRPGNATVEVARRQADGTWLWIIDQTRCS